MVNILWVQKSFAGGSFYHEGTEGTKMVDNLELATRIYVELCGQQFNDLWIQIGSESTEQRCSPMRH